MQLYNYCRHILNYCLSEGQNFEGSDEASSHCRANKRKQDITGRTPKHACQVSRRTIDDLSHLGQYSITLTRVKPKHQSPWLQAQLSRHFPESNMSCPLRARSVPDQPSKPNHMLPIHAAPPNALSGSPSSTAEQVVSPFSAILMLLVGRSSVAELSNRSSTWP